ncbi:A24 family peptidase [Photobacterium atrarenae]|uniref:Prepilin peptidase n=1 Tax=Photobacterium atrarenae TaxID=865757 RepID=A0ABY5GIR3_9GAMM|nr:prepilin peptidase [Photobacterium atrarenae]UTV28599.1 prepilin peptidase [Photobacterium atrarenae]
MISILYSLLAIAAVSDLKYSKVSNEITLMILICALIMIVFEHSLMPDQSYQFSVMALVMTLLVCLPGFIYKVFGAADVKILLIISLLTPLSLMLDILLYAFIAFMLYWCIAVRDTKVHAPFIPSLLVGMGIAVWLA